MRRLSMKKRRLLFPVLFFAIPLLLPAGFYCLTTSPAFMLLAESGCKNHTESAMYNAVLAVSEKEDFSNLAEIMISDEKITGITLNSEKVNRIRSLFAEKANALFSGNEYSEFSIPIGNLTGIPLLSGRGFKIPLRTIPLGGVEADIFSDLCDAGINQTKHSVYIKAKATVKLMYPFSSTISVSETTIPLSETVITGEIPDFFASGEK